MGFKSCCDAGYGFTLTGQILPIPLLRRGWRGVQLSDKSSNRPRPLMPPKSAGESARVLKVYDYFARLSSSNHCPLRHAADKIVLVCSDSWNRHIYHRNLVINNAALPLSFIVRMEKKSFVKCV